MYASQTLLGLDFYSAHEFRSVKSEDKDVRQFRELFLPDPLSPAQKKSIPKNERFTRARCQLLGNFQLGAQHRNQGVEFQVLLGN